MDQTYTVREVYPDGQWSGQYGTFDKYVCSFEDAQGFVEQSVEWSRKAGNQAPQAGQQVTGHIERTDRGIKFKLGKANNPTQGPPANTQQFRQPQNARPADVAAGGAPKAEFRDPGQMIRCECLAAAAKLAAAGVPNASDVLGTAKSYEAWVTFGVTQPAVSGPTDDYSDIPF